MASHGEPLWEASWDVIRPFAPPGLPPVQRVIHRTYINSFRHIKEESRQKIKQEEKEMEEGLMELSSCLPPGVTIKLAKEEEEEDVQTDDQPVAGRSDWNEKEFVAAEADKECNVVHIHIPEDEAQWMDFDWQMGDEAELECGRPKEFFALTEQDSLCMSGLSLEDEVDMTLEHHDPGSEEEEEEEVNTAYSSLLGPFLPIPLL